MLSFWGIIFVISVLLFYTLISSQPNQNSPEEKNINHQTGWGRVIALGSPINNLHQRYFIVEIDNKDIYIPLPKDNTSLSLGKKIFISFQFNPELKHYLGQIEIPPNTTPPT